MKRTARRWGGRVWEYGPVGLATVVALAVSVRALPVAWHWRLLFAACVAVNVALVGLASWGGTRRR